MKYHAYHFVEQKYIASNRISLKDYLEVLSIALKAYICLFILHYKQSTSRHFYILFCEKNEGGDYTHEFFRMIKTVTSRPYAIEMEMVSMVDCMP